MGKIFHDTKPSYPTAVSYEHFQSPTAFLQSLNQISNFLDFHQPLFANHITNKNGDDGIRGSATNSTNTSPLDDEGTAPFKPGIAVILAILATFISITFLLLLYMKHCKSSNNTTENNPISRENSGVGTKVQSLPLFRFSSLKGQKDGLECAVCLNKFDQEEMLQLPPRCKHAFHVECVDTWLDAHSTCPLCRYLVDPQDLFLIGPTNKTLCNYRDSQGKSKINATLFFRSHSPRNHS